MSNINDMSFYEEDDPTFYPYSDSEDESQDYPSEDDFEIVDVDQEEQLIRLPRKHPIQQFQSEFNAPVGAFQTFAEKFDPTAIEQSIYEINPPTVDYSTPNESAAMYAGQERMRLEKQQQEAQEKVKQFRKNMFERIKEQQAKDLEEQLEREAAVAQAIRAHVSGSGEGSNGGRNNVNGNGGGRKMNGMGMTVGSAWGEVNEDGGPSYDEEIENAPVRQRINAMRQSTQLARKALFSRQNPMDDPSNRETVVAWTKDQSGLMDIRGAALEYPRIVTDQESNDGGDGDMEYPGMGDGVRQLDDSFVIDDFATQVLVEKPVGGTRVNDGNGNGAIMVTSGLGGKTMLLQPNANKNAAQKGGALADKPKNDITLTQEERRLMFQQVRMNEMQRERQQVRQRIQKQKQAEKVAKRAAVRRQRKLQREQMKQREQELAMELAQENQQEQQVETKQVKSRQIVAEKKRDQKRIEKERYLRALQKNLMDKVAKTGEELPALCDCGVPVLENHAANCSNNCIYYGNPTAYLKALVDLLVSVGVLEY